MFIKENSFFSKDSDHRGEFIHPGDPDSNSTFAPSHTQIEKKQCRYGADCFRYY